MHYQKITAFEQDESSLFYILPACNIFRNFLSELSKRCVNHCILKFDKTSQKLTHTHPQKEERKCLLTNRYFFQPMLYVPHIGTSYLSSLAKLPI